MNVTLQNTSRFGVWITLSDGRSIDLSPRTPPVSVPARELKVNRSIKKLLDRGLVQEIKSPEKEYRKRAENNEPLEKAEKNEPEKEAKAKK